MTWLFTISLLLASIGIAITTRKIHEYNATVTRRGPVPGYSWTPGGAVDLGPMKSGSTHVSWRIRRLEEFHSNDRTRLVLSLELKHSAGDVEEALLEVARFLRERVSVDLVLVEAGSYRLLFAPDGCGWSGRGDDSILFAEVE